MREKIESGKSKFEIEIHSAQRKGTQWVAEELAIENRKSKVEYIHRRERRTQRHAEELAIESGKSKIESGIHSAQRKENAVFRGGLTKLTPSPSLEREGCPA